MVINDIVISIRHPSDGEGWKGGCSGGTLRDGAREPSIREPEGWREGDSAPLTFLPPFILPSPPLHLPAPFSLAPSLRQAQAQTQTHEHAHCCAHTNRQAELGDCLGVCLCLCVVCAVCVFLCVCVRTQNGRLNKETDEVYEATLCEDP